MPTAEYDLRFLQAGVGLLENYLLSNDIYWPIGVSAPAGSTPYPQFTLGALDLARLRLQATASTPEQRAELARLEEQMDATRSRWRVAWGKKAAAEFRARLTLWRDFLDEYREHPEANLDRYAYEAGRRVILHLLAGEAEDVPAAETSLLDGLDKFLRATSEPSGFVWDPELQPSFPSNPYWYLYVRPKKP